MFRSFSYLVAAIGFASLVACTQANKQACYDTTSGKGIQCITSSGQAVSGEPVDVDGDDKPDRLVCMNGTPAASSSDSDSDGDSHRDGGARVGDKDDDDHEDDGDSERGHKSHHCQRGGDDGDSDSDGVKNTLDCDCVDAGTPAPDVP